MPNNGKSPHDPTEQINILLETAEQMTTANKKLQDMVRGYNKMLDILLEGMTYLAENSSNPAERKIAAKALKRASSEFRETMVKINPAAKVQLSRWEKDDLTESQ